MSLLSCWLTRFARETRASASVELVIVLPLLAWALASSAVFFEGYKQRYNAEMAAQTVADIMSRETDLFTADYVDGLNTVFDFLADSRYPTRIRVSSVIWDSANDRHRLQWSYATRDMDPLPANTFELMQAGDLITLQALFGDDESFSFAGASAQMPVADLPARIPPILPGEAILLVETFALWTPFTGVGLGELRFDPVVAVRPRFAPWINFDGVETIYPEPDYEVAWTGGGNTDLPDPNDPDPTDPDPTPVSQTFTFETGITTGWSHSTITPGGPTGSFLGIFGNETYAAPVTFDVALGRANTNATIAFDLIIADSWDGYNTAHSLPRGDTLTLMIDGQPISMDVFHGSASFAPYGTTRTTALWLGQSTTRVNMTRTQSGSNFLGSGWDDQVWRVTVSVENAPQSFTLGFSAATNSTSTDEGFGIDNFSVTASGQGTAAPFTPNPAAALSPDPHTRFLRYSGCPEPRIASPGLSMTSADLWTGIAMTRTVGGPQRLSACDNFTSWPGYVHASPALILNYFADTSGATLQLQMDDGNNGYTCDSTLLVRDPNGQWYFNDDMTGYNAGLRVPNALSGQYVIFLGTYGVGLCDSRLSINRF